MSEKWWYVYVWTSSLDKVAVSGFLRHQDATAFATQLFSQSGGLITVERGS